MALLKLFVLQMIYYIQYRKSAETEAKEIGLQEKKNSHNSFNLKLDLQTVIVYMINYKNLLLVFVTVAFQGIVLL